VAVTGGRHLLERLGVQHVAVGQHHSLDVETLSRPADACNVVVVLQKTGHHLDPEFRVGLVRHILLLLHEVWLCVTLFFFEPQVYQLCAAGLLLGQHHPPDLVDAETAQILHFDDVTQHGECGGDFGVECDEDAVVLVLPLLVDLHAEEFGHPGLLDQLDLLFENCGSLLSEALHDFMIVLECNQLFQGFTLHQVLPLDSERHEHAYCTRVSVVAHHLQGQNLLNFVQH